MYVVPPRHLTYQAKRLVGAGAAKGRHEPVSRGYYRRARHRLGAARAVQVEARWLGAQKRLDAAHAHSDAGRARQQALWPRKALPHVHLVGVRVVMPVPAVAGAVAAAAAPAPAPAAAVVPTAAVVVAVGGEYTPAFTGAAV